MDREKFQQKAVKQTKQKKSTSAEFLMVEEDPEATEGAGNPGFNMSSPGLSAHRAPKEKGIKHDMLDHTLAAHQQKSRLPASAGPKGNEYRRNYFDPLEEEEINSRQYRMEVSRQGGRSKEEMLDQESLRCSSENLNIYKEDEEVDPEYTEESERQAQRGVILFPGSPSGQDWKFERKGLSQDIPMSCLKKEKAFKKALSQPCTADDNPYTKDSDTEQCSSPEVTQESGRAEGSCWKGEQPQLHRLQIQIRCIRGLKDKAPQGSYFLRVSLLNQLGSCVSQWYQTEQLKTRTCPVDHGGNFYDVGLYFHESLSVVLPQREAVKPGLSFLFELFLLHRTFAYNDLIMGWAVFPVCDNNFHIVEGKFKCPLLRGPYDQKLDSFRKIENLICQDLDQWLCNLYFKVIKTPLHLDDQKSHVSHRQLSPERPVCLMVEAENTEFNLDNTAGPSKKEPPGNIHAVMGGAIHSSQGNISNTTDPCPKGCDLCLFKEARGLGAKGDSVAAHSVKERCTVWRPGDPEDFSGNMSYLEELEKHRFSVCCPSGVDGCGSGSLSKHLHFALMSLFSELELAQWQSQSFWYILLMMASLWFLRLYLHYLGQWLFLWTLSTPVTKFQFYSYTVELCYLTSSLHVGEELAVFVLGPLALNTITFPLLLIRWGCQLLFSSCPDALSKLIITMGLWTVLDPLAVFLVDAFLGRLAHNGETPIADAAKLYWMFLRTKQPAILGALITVVVYILLFVISSLILYLYCLRLCNDSWVLDAFQRLHSEEGKFFLPHDLEISNQELSHIMRRSEQWRGIHGERRKVAVHDYNCRSHDTESSVSSCDPYHQDESFESAVGPRRVISHISVYTVYPNGFQELYRHFLRLPDGAIIEVFGDISALRFVPSEVITAVEEHIREMDTVQREIFASAQEKGELSVNIKGDH
ncbi:orofacial cleft 1 candidate gene 1 protein [Grammomys surdaster]|uniref:orofacial cleft 1 candidate gene 1 protein n=1 Tax=Grammomys surdaster TaxID=491861 RepID=UPI00109FF873|nr:orofacial cleft 1 candidate gene 1 protein [Grammomys surdaster]